jgi:hypothetical protein
MVIEPYIRMGPPPRSLAAEANDCFMVRLLRGATEYKVAARSSRARAGSPRIVGDQPSHRGSTAAPLNPASKARGVQRTPTGWGHTIPLRNGEQSMPQGRRPTGEHALSNAERQARYRACREAEQPLPKVRYRRPTDRRTRAQRWHDTVAGLAALQAEYATWYDALPDSLHDSATAEALQAIVDLDLDALTAIVPPRGYGRD